MAAATALPPQEENGFAISMIMPSCCFTPDRWVPPFLDLGSALETAFISALRKRLDVATLKHGLQHVPWLAPQRKVSCLPWQLQNWPMRKKL
jgi:hypothetical protein